jgi:iron complex outermembrane receptor protein
LPVAAGSRVPGVPQSHLTAELTRGSESGWRVRPRVEQVGAVPVNDLGTQSAPAYVVVGFDIGYGHSTPRGTMRVFGGVENLFDHDHIGSVIVNDANGRYFEPSGGRRLTLGLQWQWGGH